MQPIQNLPLTPSTLPATPGEPALPAKTDDVGETREAFDKFVGTTFFAQLLSSMRKTVEKPAYFHGGRAEEVWQSQMDQVLVDKMSESSSDRLTDPMFELFMLPPAA